MPHRRDVPDVDFLAWFDALPLDMQRTVYAEIRRECEALGLDVPAQPDLMQPALHFPPRQNPLASLN